MDEEELEQPEQPENKISIDKFFNRLEAVDAVANDAMEKAESNSAIIESQAEIIEGLKRTIELLRTDVENLSEVINVRDKQDRDAEADRLLEEEDRRQKEEMEARALAVQEQGEAQGEQGQVEEQDREKGLLGQIGDFFTDFLGGIVGAVGGLLLKSIGGIMLLGQKIIKGTKRGVGGVLDTLTFGLTDFDKRGGGGLNIFRRGREGELNEDGSKNVNYDPLAEKNISTPQALMEGINPVAKIMGMVDRSRKRKKRDERVAKQEASSEYDETYFYEGDDTGREEFIEENVTAFAQGGPVFDNDEDKTNNDEDSVPAMLTPGEFIISKGAVKKIGIDTLKRINSAAGSTSQPTVKRISKFDQGGSVLGVHRIQRLNDNRIKKSFFSDDMRDIEISNESGSDYFRKTIDTSSGGIDEKIVMRKHSTHTSEDGTVTVSSNDKTMTEKISSIGVPDLIEHQDQLLGEIHKLKGFENVTIDQVINQTTGIPQKTLLPILMRSDAQKATDEKEDKAFEEDRKARGIKSGQGFSISPDDEVAKSLKGTIGYRIGQINPPMLVSAMTNLREETKIESKTGSEPKIDPLFSDLSESINASVKGFNEGGYVTKSNATVREGKVVSGNMSQNDYDIYKAKQRYMNAIRMRGFDSPEANEAQKQLLILNGVPEEAIYTDKEGKLRTKGYSTYGDKTTIEGKDKRGILGMIGGGIDKLTGNLTDFDKRGGKTFGATRVATGMLDFATANMFDLDKRGGILDEIRGKKKNKKKKEELLEEENLDLGQVTTNEDKRGLFGVLGGVADSLTGNITDFDQRGGGIMGGSLIDALTLNLTDFDRKGGKPAGPMRMATGLIDAASGGLFDLDRRGGKPFGLMRGITGAIDHMSGNALDLDRRGGDMMGLPRLIAGGLDRMTGNVTDFDRKGGEQFGLPRMAMGILDAATGNKFDFDQKGDGTPKKSESESKDEYTEIGGERVVPGVPLSPLQRAHVTMSRQMGNDYPDDIIDLYEMGGGAPEGSELQDYMKGKNEGLFQAAPQSKSKGLIKSITDFMFNTDAKTQKLSNAMQSPPLPPVPNTSSSPIQTEPGAAMMPAQPPQVMGTKIEPTAPNIPFISLLRGNAKRYMQDSSTGSDLASYLS